MSRTTPIPSPVTIDDCKARIQALYQQSPAVTLNISLTHSKIVQDAQASITGVYRHCFCGRSSPPAQSSATPSPTPTC